MQPVIGTSYFQHVVEINKFIILQEQMDTQVESAIYEYLAHLYVVTSNIYFLLNFRNYDGFYWTFIDCNLSEIYFPLLFMCQLWRQCNHHGSDIR
jgi:hypothetical protein